MSLEKPPMDWGTLFTASPEVQTYNTLGIFCHHLFFWLFPLFQISLMVSAFCCYREHSKRSWLSLFCLCIFIIWDWVVLVAMVACWDYVADIDTILVYLR